MGREDEEDACRTTVLLVFTEAAPGPRLPRLGGPRFPFNEEGGRRRAVDAAGHCNSTKVATSESREGPAGLARLRGRVHIPRKEVRDCGKGASKGAAAVGRWTIEGIFSKVARHYCILRFSRKVRPPHVTKKASIGLPDVGICSRPLLKTPEGHPPGPAVEEAVDQAHAAPAVRTGVARFMFEWF